MSAFQKADSCSAAKAAYSITSSAAATRAPIPTKCGRSIGGECLANDFDRPGGNGVRVLAGCTQDGGLNKKAAPLREPKAVPFLGTQKGILNFLTLAQVSMRDVT